MTKRDDREREMERVDDLLAMVPAPEPVDGLAESVIAGTRAEREVIERELERVDLLLDRDPEPTALAGLADRVLAATAAERGLPSAPVRPGTGGPSRGRGPRRTAGPRRLVYASVAAAAALVLSVALGLFDERAVDQPAERIASHDPSTGTPAPIDPVLNNTAGMTEPGQPAPLDPSAEAALLADLAVLEEWDLLMDEDLEVLLAGLEEVDEWLLELAEDENG